MKKQSSHPSICPSFCIDIIIPRLLILDFLIKSETSAPFPYTERNYLGRNLQHDLDQEILSRINSRLDCDLDNFNPDIGWIAISGPSNNG